MLGLSRAALSTLRLGPRASGFAVPRAAAFATTAGADTGHYDALGVARAATLKEIKAAYYRASLRDHPDRNQNSPEAHARFTRISQAYEVLSDELLRRDYDRTLDDADAAGGGRGGTASASGRTARGGSGTTTGFRPNRAAAAGRAQTMRFNQDAHYAEHYGRSGGGTAEARRRAAEEEDAAYRQHRDRLSGLKIAGLVLLVVWLAHITTRHRERRQAKEREAERRRREAEAQQMQAQALGVPVDGAGPSSDPLAKSTRQTRREARRQQKEERRAAKVRPATTGPCKPTAEPPATKRAEPGPVAPPPAAVAAAVVLGSAVGSDAAPVTELEAMGPPHGAWETTFGASSEAPAMGAPAMGAPAMGPGAGALETTFGAPSEATDDAFLERDSDDPDRDV